MLLLAFSCPECQEVKSGTQEHDQGLLPEWLQSNHRVIALPSTPYSTLESVHVAGGWTQQSARNRSQVLWFWGIVFLTKCLAARLNTTPMCDFSNISVFLRLFKSLPLYLTYIYTDEVKICLKKPEVSPSCWVTESYTAVSLKNRVRNLWPMSIENKLMMIQSHCNLNN